MGISSASVSHACCFARSLGVLTRCQKLHHGRPSRTKVPPADNGITQKRVTNLIEPETKLPQTHFVEGNVEGRHGIGDHVSVRFQPDRRGEGDQDDDDGNDGDHCGSRHHAANTTGTGSGDRGAGVETTSHHVGNPQKENQKKTSPLGFPWMESSGQRAINVSIIEDSGSVQWKKTSDNDENIAEI
jgi:hypothetical protein